MKKFTLNLKKCILLCSCLAFCLFSGFELPEEQRDYVQNFLLKYYDLEAEAPAVKSYEINVTNTGFCRYRKLHINGKQEFFAFNFSRFKSMDYYGNGTKGQLYLRTKNDDVIVQTRNDKKGEIDSMGSFVVIPLKNVEVERLNEFAEKLSAINRSTGKGN